MLVAARVVVPPKQQLPRVADRSLEAVFVQVVLLGEVPAFVLHHFVVICPVVVLVVALVALVSHFVVPDSLAEQIFNKDNVSNTQCFYNKQSGFFFWFVLVF